MYLLNRLIKTGLVLLTINSLFGCENAEIPTPPTVPAPSSAAQTSSTVESTSSVSVSSDSVNADGEAAYSAQCQACHGAANGDGTWTGNIPNGDIDLNSPGHGITDEASLAQYIADTMPPANPGACAGTCATDVAEYMWSFVGGTAPQSSAPVSSSSAASLSAEAETGKARFKSTNCHTCHGEGNGDGTWTGIVPDYNFDVNNLDPANNITDEASMAQYLVDEMPPVDPTLCEAECAAEIATYLWTFYTGPVASSSSTPTSTPAASSSSSAASVSSETSSSSTPAVSSEPVASSSASSVVVVETGDPVAGLDQYESQCAACHGDNDGNGFWDSTNDAWDIDINSLGNGITSEATLATYIEDEMPPFGSEDNCVGDCALDIAAYMWSFKAP